MYWSWASLDYLVVIDWTQEFIEVYKAIQRTFWRNSGVSISGNGPSAHCEAILSLVSKWLDVYFYNNKSLWKSRLRVCAEGYILNGRGPAKLIFGPRSVVPAGPSEDTLAPCHRSSRVYPATRKLGSYCNPRTAFIRLSGRGIIWVWPWMINEPRSQGCGNGRGWGGKGGGGCGVGCSYSVLRNMLLKLYNLLLVVKRGRERGTFLKDWSLQR